MRGDALSIAPRSSVSKAARERILLDLGPPLVPLLWGCWRVGLNSAGWLGQAAPKVQAGPATPGATGKATKCWEAHSLQDQTGLQASPATVEAHRSKSQDKCPIWFVTPGGLTEATGQAASAGEAPGFQSSPGTPVNLDGPQARLASAEQAAGFNKQPEAPNTCPKQPGTPVEPRWATGKAYKCRPKGAQQVSKAALPHQ